MVNYKQGIRIRGALLETSIARRRSYLVSQSVQRVFRGIKATRL